MAVTTDDLDAIRSLALTDKSGADLIQAMGDNAAKWAAAFCAIAKTLGHDIDEGWMIAWFANAIEASHDKRTGRAPARLPDGSGFFVSCI
jgi:hypothetical protein